MVNTADEARAVVASAKFPPVGIRGQGSAFPCFEFGLGTPAEYVAQANNTVLTMIQIESAAGLSNIEEICQVDGIGMMCLYKSFDDTDRNQTWFSSALTIWRWHFWATCRQNTPRKCSSMQSKPYELRQQSMERKLAFLLLTVLKHEMRRKTSTSLR